MSKYTSPISVAQRKPIELAANDPNAYSVIALKQFTANSGSTVVVSDEYTPINLDEEMWWASSIRMLYNAKPALGALAPGDNGSIYAYFPFTDSGSSQSHAKIDKYGELEWSKEFDVLNTLNIPGTTYPTFKAVEANPSAIYFVSVCDPSTSVPQSIRFTKLIPYGWFGGPEFCASVNSPATEGDKGSFSYVFPFNQEFYLSADSNENLYVSCKDGSNKGFLLRFNQNNGVATLPTNKYFLGPASEATNFKSNFYVDEFVYVVGYIGSNYFITKLEPSAFAHQWTKKLTSATMQYNSNISGGDGNIYVGGSDNNVPFIIKYDYDGNAIWKSPIILTGYSGSVKKIWYSSNNIFFILSNAHNGKWVYGRMDADTGAVLWMNGLSTTSTNMTGIYDMIIDGVGRIAILAGDTSESYVRVYLYSLCSSGDIYGTFDADPYQITIGAIDTTGLDSVVNFTSGTQPHTGIVLQATAGPSQIISSEYATFSQHNYPESWSPPYGYPVSGYTDQIYY